MSVDLTSKIDYENVLKEYSSDKTIKKNMDDIYIIAPSNEELTWKNIIKYNNGQTDNKFIDGYNKFRNNMVNSILAHAAQKNKCENECSAVSVGTATPTSDYDLSIYGSQSGKVVKDFNDVFRKIFKKESGDIFDTNVYGSYSFEPTAVSTTYTLTKASKDINKSI
jgi:hypothetical protein